jgi:ribosomal protein S18 acetylase RimI-like enzyme
VVTVKFVDVEPADPRLTRELLPVLLQLRPLLTASTLRGIYTEGHGQGLRFTAAYNDTGTCVAVAGWRIQASASCGRKLSIDDLVTDERHRGSGAGKALLGELTARARQAGCAVVDLDSAVHHAYAHRFYARMGMTIDAFRFSRPLGD